MSSKIVTSVDGAPITKEYPLPRQEDVVSAPHANKAVSKEHPDGSEDAKFKHLSVMQQHVKFFDFDNDGRILPWDTYNGFRLMGFNMLYSFLAMWFIHLALSYGTQESWIPHPLFPILIKNIHKNKHGSDSDVYDSEGRFRPQQFEELFAKFAKREQDKLHVGEMFNFLRRHQRPLDLFGWAATFLEWITLWLLCAEGRGLNSYLTKEHIRQQYDGTLFYKMADKEAAIRKKTGGKGQKNEAVKSAINQSAEAVQHGVKNAKQHAMNSAHKAGEKMEQLRDRTTQAANKEE